MDQSRFWIQKEQTCLNSRVLSSLGDSWEEQAFAEDATGPLGGCIWPPRSYTCSFCRREFRSAQALGGHMNVHRRDRARLKKISSSNNNQDLEPHTSFDICVLPNPNKISNPNFDHLDHPLYSSSSPRPSTVSILHPFTCSFGHEKQKGNPILTCSKFEYEPAEKICHTVDLGNQDKASTKVLESSFTTTMKNTQQIELHSESDINSLIRKRCDGEKPFSSKKDDEQDGFIFKKRRIEGDVRSFLPRNSNMLNSNEVESVLPVSKHSTNSTSDTLDLELRLGDRPGLIR
ncbi:hypothetical protein R6Q59_028564 [Mikania micrantha]|uniref:C2H2-type domain-containing protein n=1 Tax=Mikania micrantha TaxID=192012 RepID=A0A5N6M704_9ASTR|nr:hypothetical protein E3N88_31726 [Mikania micrantha]